MVYAKPTSSMEIKAGKHVNQNGKVYLPYLHDWKHVSVRSAAEVMTLMALVAFGAGLILRTYEILYAKLKWQWQIRGQGVGPPILVQRKEILPINAPQSIFIFHNFLIPIPPLYFRHRLEPLHFLNPGYAPEGL